MCPQCVERKGRRRGKVMCLKLIGVYIAELFRLFQFTWEESILLKHCHKDNFI